MIRTIILIFLLITGFSALAQIPSEGVTIRISNLRNNKGHVLVSLFRDDKGFPGDARKALRREKITILDKKGTLHLPSLPSGTYAVAILHDENDDLKMNTNWLGIPKEGYGFSNNVMGTFGPPSFTKASFSHVNTRPSIIEISTKY
jgi:uncharacterized protein (DUF2141 family)